jgi:branched-chain amino acid transport system permease protein
MSVLVQLLLNGLLLGGIYAIISVGLTLIFGIVRVVNFAHGEFLMASMYAAFLLSAKLGLHPYVSVLPLIVLFFILGALVQRLIIDPLLDADAHIQIFATVGLSTALLNLALLVFGANMMSIAPSGAQKTLALGEYRVVVAHVIMFGVAIALVVAMHLFMHRTFLGRAIRATAQNRTAALLMGVDVRWIYVITFGIGSACVGLAGALLTPVYPVFPTIGTYFVLTAFVIVVLGGMGSLYGAFLGAMIIGVVDTLSGYYVAPDLKEVVYFMLFLIILVTKPTGLLGLGRGSE